jgi:predicted RNA-binding protein with PUA-like domain
MKLQHWLMKTEPETYSFEQLLKDKKTNWNGVRNFQARNHLKNVKKGDLVLIYHSGDVRAVVGVAEVSRDGYPDPDPKKAGDWVQIDLIPEQKLKNPVTLSSIKSETSLKNMPLIKQSRLSVMPITAAEYAKILKMAHS